MPVSTQARPRIDDQVWEDAMPGYRRVCCPVDFSDPSHLALVEAARIARREGAALTVLHVKEAQVQYVEGPFAPPPPPHGEGASPALEAWRAEAEGIRGGPVDAVLLDAPVVPAIHAFARDTGVDLIVLASHGRTGLARLMLGSVAEAVVRTAPCPVLVLRAPEAPVAREEEAAAERIPVSVPP
jgi:nucleotide-binding universal stress UspA family protein